MRWDDLFADLEAQADVLDIAERAAEIGERARIEVGALGVSDRLRAALDRQIQVQCIGGLLLSGTLRRAGPDWLLVEESSEREAVVAIAALRSVQGLGRYAAVPGSAGPVLAKLTLRSILRGIARDRSAVRLHLVDGGGDGAVVDATIDRVGADFLEVARHAPAEARRHDQVRDASLIPLAAVAAVRRAVG